MREFKKLSVKAPIRNLDYTIIIVTMLLAIGGALMIYSATYSGVPGQNQEAYNFLRNQIIWIILGLLAMTFIVSIDYYYLKKYATHFYIFICFLLVLVLLMGVGRTELGASRWIAIGPFQLQPSEFAKIALIIILAKFLSKFKGEITQRRDVFLALAIMVIPMLLIFKQPDLGTGLTFTAIFLGMLFVAGAKLIRVVEVTALGIVAVAATIFLHILKDYQIKRLIVFLNPDTDPLGDGYNLLQSKIAIGSGQVFGKGLHAGTQTRLNFIPAHHTDFIFASLGEKIGFFGALIFIILFFILIWRGTKAARLSKDLFGTLLATGVLCMLSFEIFVNIGMTMGIMPITGIPLPLISYGGSSMMTTMIGIGILMSVYMRRYIQIKGEWETV